MRAFRSGVELRVVLVLLLISIGSFFRHFCRLLLLTQRSLLAWCQLLLLKEVVFVDPVRSGSLTRRIVVQQTAS